MARELAVLRAFIDDQRRRGLSPKTISGRTRTLQAFFSCLGETPAVAATTDDVQDWLDGCQLTPRSRYTYLSTLAAFYAWAVDAGHALADPTSKIRRPRTGRLVPRPIADADLEVALRTADPRMRVMIAFGAYQGLRTVEMSGVRREDVMEGRDPPLLLVTRGKGGRERVVPLHAETLRALHVLPMPHRGPILRLVDGSGMRPETIGSYIARHLKGLGIAASAHQLRHAYGSAVYRLSRDIRLTQELLGHADPKTTAIYAAWSPGDAAAVIARL